MKSMLAVAAGLLIATSSVSSAADGQGGPQRGISIDQILKIADTAVGYPKGRPQSLEVVTAKLFFMKEQDLALEGISGDPKALQSKLRGKEYWLVVYRKWPIRLDGDLAVFVDAHSGDPIAITSSR